MIKIKRGNFKMSLESMQYIVDKLDEALPKMGKGNMTDVVNYLQSPEEFGYKNRTVQISVILSRIISSKWVCDNLYPQGLNDDHIFRTMEHILKTLEDYYLSKL